MKKITTALSFISLILIHFNFVQAAAADLENYGLFMIVKGSVKIIKNSQNKT